MILTVLFLVERNIGSNYNDKLYYNDNDREILENTGSDTYLIKSETKKLIPNNPVTLSTESNHFYYIYAKKAFSVQNKPEGTIIIVTKKNAENFILSTVEEQNVEIFSCKMSDQFNNFLVLSKNCEFSLKIRSGERYDRYFVINPNSMSIKSNFNEKNLKLTINGQNVNEFNGKSCVIDGEIDIYEDIAHISVNSDVSDETLPDGVFNLNSLSSFTKENKISEEDTFYYEYGNFCSFYTEWVQSKIIIKPNSPLCIYGKPKKFYYFYGAEKLTIYGHETSPEFNDNNNWRSSNEAVMFATPLGNNAYYEVVSETEQEIELLITPYSDNSAVILQNTFSDVIYGNIDNNIEHFIILHPNGVNISVSYPISNSKKETFRKKIFSIQRKDVYWLSFNSDNIATCLPNASYELIPYYIYSLSDPQLENQGSSIYDSYFSKRALDLKDNSLYLLPDHPLRIRLTYKSVYIFHANHELKLLKSTMLEEDEEVFNDAFIVSTDYSYVEPYFYYLSSKVEQRVDVYQSYIVNEDTEIKVTTENFSLNNYKGDIIIFNPNKMTYDGKRCAIKNDMFFQCNFENESNNNFTSYTGEYSIINYPPLFSRYGRVYTKTNPYEVITRNDFLAIIIIISIFAFSAIVVSIVFCCVFTRKTQKVEVDYKKVLRNDDKNSNIMDLSDLSDDSNP